jgi:uncharacterized protein (TIRG00374 family)
VPSLGRLAKIVLGVAISVASLVYLFWSVDPRDVLAHLATTNWTFLTISLVLNLGSVWIRSWRWYYLYPPGSRPSHLFNALMIGYMANNILPLRAGEVVRVYIASRHGPRFWTSVATLVVERVLDGLAVGLILAGLFLTLPIPPKWFWPAMIFLAVDAAGMIALAVIALAPGACATCIRVLFHNWARLERWLLDALGTMSEGLKGVRARRHLLPIAVSSVAIWLVLALAVWTALHAAHLDLPFAASWAVLAFMGLGVSLPSSPGFVGVIQLATVGALSLFSVPDTEALSFSLIFHAAQYFPVTLFGLVLLLVEQVSLAEAARGTRSPVPSAPH